MFRAGLFLLLALPLLPATDDVVKPDKLPISTWVREDLFAGWISNDAATLERGVRKLDRILKDRPNDRGALAWKYLATSFWMRRALQKHDDTEYRRLLSIAGELRERIFTGNDKDAGACIIVGSSLLGVAPFAGPEEGMAMYRDGREMLSKVPGLQAQFFDTLPPHMRGELWAEIAFASDRLGDTAERDRVLNEMLTRLAGSPYEARARAWMKDGALQSEKQYQCISCHEPGRLEPTLARLKTN